MTYSEACYQMSFGHCCTRSSWEDLYIKMYINVLKQNESSDSFDDFEIRVMNAKANTKNHTYKLTQPDLDAQDWVIFER